MSSITPDVFTGPERGVKPRRFDFTDDHAPQGSKHEVNVGSTERAVTGAVGGALLAAGAAMIWRNRDSTAAWLTGVAAAGIGTTLLYRGATGHCSGYEALGIHGDDATTGAAPWSRQIHVRHSVRVNKSPQELFDFWRNLANLPRVMPHLERVEDLGGGRSRWVAKAPPGASMATGEAQQVTWTARITDELPGERIAWQTEPGAPVEHRGQVEFRSDGDDRGTLVRATFEYQPVGGVFAALVAKVFGEDPGQQAKEDLRRFKAHMEAGEVPTIEGQPRGTCS